MAGKLALSHEPDLATQVQVRVHPTNHRAVLQPVLDITRRNAKGEDKNEGKHWFMLEKKKEKY